jgi:hypothetical protein
MMTRFKLWFMVFDSTSRSHCREQFRTSTGALDDQGNFKKIETVLTSRVLTPKKQKARSQSSIPL